MPKIEVSFIQLPRHTPPGAGFEDEAPCYDFVGTPPAIRWDALLQFVVPPTVVAEHKDKKLVVYQKLVNVSKWYAGFPERLCKEQMISIAEFFGVDKRGFCAPDTHSVATLWSLECEKYTKRVGGPGMEGYDIDKYKSCRVESRIRSILEVREYKTEALAAGLGDTPGFPGCGYGPIEHGATDQYVEQGGSGAASAAVESAQKRADEVAKYVTTAVEGTSTEYRYTAGVEHCKTITTQDHVPLRSDGFIPAMLNNETDIPVRVPAWLYDRLWEALLPAASRVERLGGSGGQAPSRSVVTSAGARLTPGGAAFTPIPAGVRIGLTGVAPSVGLLHLAAAGIGAGGHRAGTAACGPCVDAGDCGCRL